MFNNKYSEKFSLVNFNDDNDNVDVGEDIMNFIYRVDVSGIFEIAPRGLQFTNKFRWAVNVVFRNVDAENIKSHLSKI